MEMESPEFRTPLFPDQKERPAEAPFWALEKWRLNEDLKCTAGLAPKKIKPKKSHSFQNGF
jgi:hypothetical protein